MARLDGCEQGRDPNLFSRKTAYGDEAYAWFVRWRVFYIAVEEMFAYDGGEEWGVSHYKFVKD